MKMDLSLVTRLWFNLYCETQEANNNLPEGVQPLDRAQMKEVTTTLFIQSNMNGTAAVIQNKTISQPPQGESNWDGEKITGFKKGDWAGKKWNQLDNKSLDWIVDKHDSSKNFPNYAQFEIDRRKGEDVDEPPPEDFSGDLAADDDSLPF